MLLSSLFLSLLHYCPRLTAFTSSAGFIWPLCQLRQIGPAATTRYAMAEATVKYKPLELSYWFRWLFSLLPDLSWLVWRAKKKKKNPTTLLFSLFLLIFLCFLRFASACCVLWCSCLKLQSSKRLSSSLFTCPLLRTLIGGSNCSAPFQNPYPKKIMILISYITALSILHFCSAVHDDSQCLVLLKKKSSATALIAIGASFN